MFSNCPVDISQINSFISSFLSPVRSKVDIYLLVEIGKAEIFLRYFLNLETIIMPKCI